MFEDEEYFNYMVKRCVDHPEYSHRFAMMLLILELTGVYQGD